VVATDDYTASGWPALARRVQDAGFDTLLVADHYGNPMACTPLIAAAAAATSTLRVGSYVYCNDFRHPALVAKEVATMDVLSAGRVEFGIGAGWSKEEYDQVGVPFDQPRLRADRLEEAVELILRVLGGGTVSFEGAHYRLDDYPALPKTVQDRVPLLIGGGGPRMIRLAARHADIYGLTPRSLPQGGLDPADFAADAVERKLQVLAQALDAEDRPPEDLEVSALVFGIYRTPEECPRNGWIPPELVSESPLALVGGPDRVADTLYQRRQQLNLSYYVCFASDLDRMEPIVAAVKDR
jgi:probable F420-dependent oxidoreductase